MTLAIGLFTGVLFGLLMQRALVLRYDKQLGALLLKDMTIVKFMLSAIVVAAIGLHLCLDLGLLELSVKGTEVGAQLIGGGLFGIGWAMLGYCPGTAWGALGEGRYDGLWGILGGWFGTAIYAEVYPTLQTSVLTWGAYGKLTWASMLGINHWIPVLVLTVISILLFRFFEKKGL
ncbi:MAG: YeeE/YedE family protein [Proteobacteria bacterium]|nr:YeeE/YedE family protein [Pseudomonadota bacterium]MBU1611558.1 YeeE/YedE family protein [Pseudomonadota bacterium]